MRTHRRSRSSTPFLTPVDGDMWEGIRPVPFDVETNDSDDNSQRPGTFVPRSTPKLIVIDYTKPVGLFWFGSPLHSLFLCWMSLHEVPI